MEKINIRNLNISILQPIIPHYREDFFKLLSTRFVLKLFTYVKDDSTTKFFELINLDNEHIANISYKSILFYKYNMLIKGADVLVLMLHKGHFTTWMLLLTKIFHRRKIILWGHGISIPRYLKEEKSLNKFNQLMLYLADGVWFYTKKELLLWKNKIPHLNAISLDNSLSTVEHILSLPVIKKKEKDKIKNDFGFSDEILILISTRFNSIHKRGDVFKELIKHLDSSKFGFIIIGDGKYKPDFSSFSNVRDFGSLYDEQIKKTLFSISDIYFQPGWVGLSIVEAMAYGLPIFTLERTSENLQCVEYNYIENGKNGFIYSDLKMLIDDDIIFDKYRLEQLGKNARKYVSSNLTMNNMVNKAVNHINTLK